MIHGVCGTYTRSSGGFCDSPTRAAETGLASRSSGLAGSIRQWGTSMGEASFWPSVWRHGTKAARPVAATAAVLAAASMPVVLSGAVAHAATSVADTALINGDTVTAVDGITDSSGNPISLEQYAAE